MIENISRKYALRCIIETLDQFQVRVMQPLDKNHHLYDRATHGKALRLHEQFTEFSTAVDNLMEDTDLIYYMDAAELSQLLSLCRDISELYDLPVHREIPDGEVLEVDDEITIPFELPIICNYCFSDDIVEVTLDLDDGNLQSNSVVTSDGTSRVRTPNSFLPRLLFQFTDKFVEGLTPFAYHVVDNIRKLEVENLGIGGIQNMEWSKVSDAISGPLGDIAKVAAKSVLEPQFEEIKEAWRQRYQERSNGEQPSEDEDEQQDTQSNTGVSGNITTERVVVGAKATGENWRVYSDLFFNYDWRNIFNRDNWGQIIQGIGFDTGFELGNFGLEAGVGIPFADQTNPYVLFTYRFGPNREITYSLRLDSMCVGPGIDFNALLTPNTEVSASLFIKHAYGDRLFPGGFTLCFTILRKLGN
jgi:hypothetical protein